MFRLLTLKLQRQRADRPASRRTGIKSFNKEVALSITLKITVIGVLFLLIIISGISLARTGKPYSPVLFNIHKLISLAGVVLTGIVVYNLLRGLEVSPLMWALVIVTGVFFIILIVSGGLLILDKPFYNLLRTIHRILPAVSIILTAVIFFFLLRK